MTSPISDAFRLSPKQEHLWSLGQWKGQTPYVAQCVVKIEGSLDRSALKEGLAKIVEQHEILRTNFKHWAEMNIPVQAISKVQIAWADPRDLQKVPAQDQQRELQRLIDTSGQIAFDLEQGPVLHAQLVQLSLWEHHLLLTLPALCADYQTLGCFVEQISSYYANGSQLEETGEKAFQYADISQWYYDALESEDAHVGREYWRRQSVSGAGFIALPFEKRATISMDFRPLVLAAKLTDELSRKIAEFERNEKISLPVVLLSCWQLLLWRLTRQSPLQIGLACNGRSYPELRNAFGLLTAHVPILSSVDAETKSKDIFQDTAAKMNEAWEWQDGFSWSGASAFDSDSPLSFFPICFEFSQQQTAFITGGTTFSIHRQSACIDRFKIKLLCIRVDDSVVTEFHYDSELFDLESIQFLAWRFRALLAGVLADPDAPAGTLEGLLETERQTLAAYNATAQEPADYHSFQELFEIQVERSPDALALCCGDEQFSYTQLNVAANNVARQLLRFGIGPEKRVALCLDRSPLAVIALLGTLKTGAAYLPLDVQVPARRLQFILKDAQVSAVLTQTRFRGLLPEDSNFPILCLDANLFSGNGGTSENPLGVAQPENLAYVIYTSGSTGSPKGAMISHRGLANYLLWARKAYRIGERSRTLVHTPFSFDLTITGLLLPLITGGTVELVSSGDELERLCVALSDSQQHYALIKLTPSHLQVLGAWLGERELHGRIDALVIGGEALPGDLLTVWQQQSVETRLINEYGPTETVVGCSTYEVRPSAGCTGGVPIGRPIGNMCLYVLDERMRVLPIGVTGEIYIGGAGVARGYLSLPCLTAERFVPDPFSAEPGKRLYRSGDLGRLRADGHMEYFGRTDEQVKIGGFRIELGEIESLLRQHYLVKASAAVVQETGTEKRLVAYAVLSDAIAQEAGESVREDIREYLKRELPGYMLPKNLIFLDYMPLTPNGKIDRKALPLPSRESREADDSYADLSPVGRILTRIWCGLLAREHVKVNDNFFALGGDSIVAVQIAFKAKQMGINFHPMLLFRHPTIAQLEIAIGTSSAAFSEQALPSIAPSEQSFQHAPGDFPLAHLNREQLDHILRKASK